MVAKKISNKKAPKPISKPSSKVYTITKKRKSDITGLGKQHKYTKYYPSILDPNFSHKIASHNIFKKYKNKSNFTTN